MEILLVLALIIAAGSGKNVPPPQKLLETLSALSGGANGDIWESDLLKDVRILGMTPAQLIAAAKELQTLASELTAAKTAPECEKKSAPAPFSAPEEQENAGEEDFLAPVRGIADENIERMLGKYFS